VSITYTSASGCTTVRTETVNPLPGAVAGTTDVVIGGNSTLANSVSGGVWTSASPSVATIGSSTGLLTGVSGGTIQVTYTLSTGCLTTTSITVNPVLGIVGASTVCIGYNTTLTNATGGGTWVSSNPSVASIGSNTGIVTGLSTGTSVITYNVPSVGYRVLVLSSHMAPSAITGPSSVCVGQTSTYINASAGGYWTSSTPTIATVNSATGVVTGIAGGLTATINYTIGTGCSTTTTVNVNALAAISGATSVCSGQPITLTNAAAGGIWSSTTPSIATVGSTSGIVSGVSSGVSVISYVLASGCTTTFTVIVNALSPISGPSSVCVSQAITLINSGGGTWSSYAPTVATIGATTGVVTGIAGGLSTNITYTLGSGCRTTMVVSVNALAAITGTMSACMGLTTTLADAATGGTWISSQPTIASIGSASGIVTGLSGGTSAISYVMPTGCTSTTVVTIGNLSAITGGSSVCMGQSKTLANAISGGVWSSSAPTIASIVSNTGVVIGNAGNLSATISYTLSSGCRATLILGVNPLQPISGSATSICAGQGTTLTDAATGGTWLSSAPGVATIGSTTGSVTGIGAGTNVITYLLPTGCMATYAMTVNPLAPITVAGNVCLGATITLANAVTGGTWASAAPTIASVVTATGVVTGAAANLSTTLTYTLGTGCRTTATVSVAALPAVPATIGGPSTVSMSGSSITLTNTTAGGNWTSSNIGRASVVPTSGVVTGVGLGTVIITYTVANAAGCTNQVTKVITVGPAPPPHSITAKTVSINVDGSFALNETIKGGTWSCDDCEGVVSLNIETGTINGIATGRATITYTVNDEFGISMSITKVIVNAQPETAITLTKEGNVYLIPNPNMGEFTIKGNLTTTIDEDITIEIVDILGQTIYKGNAKAIEGKIYEQVVLSNTLANGMYLLNLHSTAEHYVFHFLVER